MHRIFKIRTNRNPLGVFLGALGFSAVAFLFIAIWSLEFDQLTPHRPTPSISIMFPLLASDVSSIASVLGWSAVLLGILLVAFFAYTQFKRRMQTPQDTSSGGFTLSDVRELHRQGKLSKEEFEAMKLKILATMKGASSPSEAMETKRAQPSKNITPEIDPKAGP